VYAQDRAAPASGASDVPRWQPSAEDISAFTDARVAALKAGLKLTPEQEKNWPAFEQAYRDLAKARADQVRAFREQRQSNQSGTDYLTRLQRRADALIARGNALKSFGAAAAPLYQSLDEAQKHRFAALSRAMGPRHLHRLAAWQRGANEQR
jgi:zinc resistance-associated protein